MNAPPERPVGAVRVDDDGSGRPAARSATTRRVALAAAVLLPLVTLSAGAWWWNNDDPQDAGEAAREIGWEDLLPEGFEPVGDPFAHLSNEDFEKLFDGSAESNAELDRIEKAMAYAPTNDELDGQRVRIPGYVVPLDFDGQTRVEEFLLVPYYGACIHTPPPPANQVVHADAGETIEIESLYDPIWAIGTISTETVTSDLAESGYRLTIERIEAFDMDDW